MLTKNGWAGNINYKENKSEEKVLVSEENKKYCTGCGKKVAVISSFCAHCGAEIG